VIASVRRLSWYALTPVLVVLGSSAVSAFTAGAPNQGNQSNAGQMLSDTGAFSVARTEIGVVAVDQNESHVPCLDWGSSNCVAHGGLSAGHWFLLVELQLDALSSQTCTYDVSVQIDSGGLVLQPIGFAIASSTVPGTAGTFSWDLGPSFNTPLAYTVTVTNG
jgi:hypothetical protein